MVLQLYSTSLIVMVMVMLSVVVVVIYSALVRSHQSTYEGMGALRLVVPPPGGHIKRAQNSGNAYLVKHTPFATSTPTQTPAYPSNPDMGSERPTMRSAGPEWEKATQHTVRHCELEHTQLRRLRLRVAILEVGALAIHTCACA